MIAGRFAYYSIRRRPISAFILYMALFSSLKLIAEALASIHADNVTSNALRAEQNAQLKRIADELAGPEIVGIVPTHEAPSDRP